MAEAIWMKNNLARAKMALPNGFCTLPLQKTCQYANACFSELIVLAIVSRLAGKVIGARWPV